MRRLVLLLTVLLVGCAQQRLVTKLRVQSFIYRHSSHAAVLVNHDPSWTSCIWQLPDGSLSFGNCTPPVSEVGCGG